MQTYRSQLISVILIIIAASAMNSAQTPEFNASRAFSHLVKQCEFGPRNPGSPGHKACLEYLVAALRLEADEVQLQQFSMRLPGSAKKPVHLVNIIARFGKQQQQRILLCAHWDTRPWADQDPDPTNRNVPILGANDGASGVAVLLEMALILGKNPAPIGVDIVLFDAEDAGLEGRLDTWCLGSSHFSKSGLLSPRPEYAILLDLVGDSDLTFPVEQYSNLYAPVFVKKIWRRAADLGLDAFKEIDGPTVIDDHLNLLRAGISAVDIIDFDYPYWHTIEDTPDKCSPESLATVGRLLVSLIYEK
jgi:glutaminyl-peptide cyclotransferase